MWSCQAPKPPETKNDVTRRAKHNYIVLLDLSDRLIVQENQPARDKEIIKALYTNFEKRVKDNLYIKSRDEIKVVIAPQRGARLRRDVYEDRLYINMGNINMVSRRPKEEERRNNFIANLDTLYKEAVFSRTPADYFGADIWKYFYEDLKVDYASDSLTENYLFILTDGYPIVGTDQNKLRETKNKYPHLHVILIEAAPRDKDLEWDRIMSIWEEWFQKIGVENYTLIKRGALTKEIEQLHKLLSAEK